MISPADVVRVSASGFLRMKQPRPKNKYVVTVQGDTEPIKDELQSLGFKWNQMNRVWYQLRHLTREQFEVIAAAKAYGPELDIVFRHFELFTEGWKERQTWYPI